MAWGIALARALLNMVRSWAAQSMHAPSLLMLMPPDILLIAVRVVPGWSIKCALSNCVRGLVFCEVMPRKCS
jgi:hypothetical protein